ncbi:transcription factor IIIB 50 kDa subunit [Polymixia lowei]
MATVGMTCPDCGSSNVIDDDLYAQAQMVCADCGSVVSEGVLTTDRIDAHTGTTDVRYSQTTAVTNQPCQNQIKGLQRVRALCRILRLNKEIEELAETYYKQAYEHPSFIRVSLQKKEVLVGCCVLVSCGMRNWPIAMGTISCLLEADPALMGVVYRDMVKALKIEAPKASITDILETHTQEYKISSLHVPEEMAENSKDLTKRAVALVELAADSWIVTGRRPLPIMMASIFLAWQSLKPTKSRLKYSLDRFCELAKVTKNKTALKRVTEIKEVLCKLGQEIPWLGFEVTPHSVIKVVEDILEHRYALLRMALKTHEEALPADLQPSLEDSLPEIQTNASSLMEAAPSQISEQVKQSAIGSCVEPCGTNTGGDQQPAGGNKVNEGNKASTPNWGKRVLFAPPCVKHAKIRRTERPAQTEVTGDEDISDSEIDMYIRTPQEVRDFTRTQKMLCSSEDGE